jgi:hypothetical protein
MNSFFFGRRFSCSVVFEKLHVLQWVRGTSHLSQEYFTKKCLLEGVNFRGNMCFKPAASDFSKISSPRQRRMFLVVSVVLE